MNLKIVHLLLFLIPFWTNVCTAGFANASEEITLARDGKLLFKARGSTLKEIVREFDKKHSVEIKGLEGREDEKITFSFETDTLESLLKSLLRHLGIKNYAIEFADERLKRVVVVPEPTVDVPATSKLETVPPNQKEFVDVAQVQSIIESSQAEKLGLLEGDIIVEYDGVKITSAQQLVKEVEKKTANNQIEMVIVREKTPERLILVGGFIGIRVMTKKIPKEEFDTFYFSD